MNNQIPQEDIIAVAQLGALVNNYNIKAAQELPNRGDIEKMNYRRVDFRNEINSSGYSPGRLLPPTPQYHQQYAPGAWQQGLPQSLPGIHPQQNPHNIPTDPDIPGGNLNLNGPPPLLQIPPRIQQYVQQTGGAIPNHNMTTENYDNFDIPDYNNVPRQGGPVFIQRLDDEEEFREALIKEIKSQKKSINKLIRDNEKLILVVENLQQVINSLLPKPVEVSEKNNDIQNKSEDIHQQVHSTSEPNS